MFTRADYDWRYEAETMRLADEAQDAHRGTISRVADDPAQTDACAAPRDAD